jgi:hypothetical protein
MIYAWWAQVAGLSAGGWIDGDTKHVTVSLAVLNLDVLAWARAALTFAFTRGGRVDYTYAVHSVPIDPYEGADGSGRALAALDVLLLLYTLFLLASCAWAIVQVR